MGDGRVVAPIRWDAFGRVVHRQRRRPRVQSETLKAVLTRLLTRWRLTPDRCTRQIFWRGGRSGAFPSLSRVPFRAPRLPLRAPGWPRLLGCAAMPLCLRPRPRRCPAARRHAAWRRTRRRAAAGAGAGAAGAAGAGAGGAGAAGGIGTERTDAWRRACTRHRRTATGPASWVGFQRVVALDRAWPCVLRACPCAR